MIEDICWKSVITDLEDKGLSLVEIGQQIGLAPSTVSDIKRGASVSPRGTPAVRLYHLHQERCQPQSADQPEVA